MCDIFGSTPKDNSAEIARKEEAARQQRIQQGQGAIDSTFAKTFSDPYYNQYQSAYTGYYQPQVDQQYAEAKRKAILALSGSGQLASSAGGRTLGQLTRRYNDTQAQIGNQAVTAAQDLRSKVEQQKNSLYALNQSAADPSAVAAQAAAATQSLTGPASYSPIGNVFADLLNFGATGLQAQNAGYRGLGPSIFSPSSSKGSVNYVR